MAHWNRRPKTGHVRIWDKSHKSLPRKRYRHLDGESDETIEAWVRAYEVQYEGKRYTPEHLVTQFHRSQVDDFLLDVRNREERDEKTIQQHKFNLLTYALPYFMDRETPLASPAEWPLVSVNLWAYLLQHEVGKPTINKVNQSLAKFWRFLQKRNLAPAVPLPLDNCIIGSQKTTLPARTTPDDMLAMARKIACTQTRFVVLCGYFFSLRPQETFALLAKDFRGDKIDKLACTGFMQAAGLYTGLAVKLSHQRDASGTFKPMKTAASRGWVSCFNRDAAAMIVECVLTMEDNNWLEFGYKHYYNTWRECIPGTPFAGYDLKDLRRASLYWLGHHTDMSPMHVMKHARHTRLQTTQQYLREPEQDVPEPIGRLRLTV